MKRLLMLLLVIGCTKAMPPATNSETTTPDVTATQPAHAVTGPRVILPDGFVVGIEIAAEEELRAQGLMYRDHLANDAGMLFFFPEEGEYPFWMKNTRIPLDMIWIDSNRRIVHITHDVPPCHVADCPNYPPHAIARYVLELAAGVAKQHGLKEGDVLRYEGTENVVVR
jgi:uncharacterized membrane protein (UPF0127 family)